MADRRALVIDSPGSIGLRGVDELVPGPGDSGLVSPSGVGAPAAGSFGPRGTIILDVAEP